MSQSFIEKELQSGLTLDVWKKLFFKYILPYRNQFISLIITAIIVAAAEACFTLVTKLVIDEIVDPQMNADLWSLGAIYLLLLSIEVICVWTFIVLAGGISTRMMYDIRKDCFHHLQKLSFSFYDKHSVGWLMARLTSDCHRLAGIIAWGTLDLFWGLPFLLGIAVVMLVLDWQLGLVVLAIVPILIWMSVYFKKIILKSSRQVRQANSKLTAAYNESINGISTSKILVREQANLIEFHALSNEMIRVSVKNELRIAAYFPAIISLGSIATGLALWFGGVKVMAALITLGTLVAFMRYTMSFFDPVLEIARVLTELQTAQAAAERIFGLLDTIPEINDDSKLIQPITHQTPTSCDPDSQIKTITFDQVDFRYESDQDVLNQFNLQVMAGETIALVGVTGGGKSTIINLLCRFYEPTSGQILINGVDYRRRSLNWLQSKLGIVLQTPHLFSGSIYENIRYGNLGASAHQIKEAAKRVSAHGFITNMKDAYQTEVGEGGCNLSTGQKQLISFARAILAEPQIFIMDEATSAVDTHTEHLIQSGLGRILKNRTSFIIAHRLSTIRSADRILVIDHGKLKEQGTHQELIARKGDYFELYKKQFCFEKENELFRGSDKQVG